MARWPAFIALCLCLIKSNAAPQVGEESLFATLKRTLESRYPDHLIVDVQRSPVPDWYEVYTGREILYTDRAGNFLLLGMLIDTRTQQDLTAARLDERGAIDFSSLPRHQAIKTVKGNGSRALAVFTDPDCEYCEQLEKALGLVTDITIYTFLYPLVARHPDAVAKSRAIWCAEDQSQAWADWMAKKALPPDRSCPSDPVESLQALGESLNIASTPTLFLQNGRRVPSAARGPRGLPLAARPIRPLRSV